MIPSPKSSLNPAVANPCAGPASVQTPEEVYQALARDGYRVDYYRVPLTDGTAPKVGLGRGGCRVRF